MILLDDHPPLVLALDRVLHADRRPVRRLAQLNSDLPDRQADRPDRIARRVDRHVAQTLDPLPKDEAKRLQALFVRRIEGVDLLLVQADPGLLFDLGKPRLPALPFRQAVTARFVTPYRSATCW